MRPDEVVRRIVEDRLNTAAGDQGTPDRDGSAISPRNAIAPKYFEARMKGEATTNPEEVRRANEEYEDLKRNLNSNRAATGERLLFP